MRAKVMCAEERSCHAPRFNRVRQLLRALRCTVATQPFLARLKALWVSLVRQRSRAKRLHFFPGGSILEQPRNQKHRRAQSKSVRKPESAVPLLPNSLLDEACNGLNTEVRASIIQIMALSLSFGTAWRKEEVKRE